MTSIFGGIKRSTWKLVLLSKLIQAPSWRIRLSNWINFTQKPRVKTPQISESSTYLVTCLHCSLNSVSKDTLFLFTGPIFLPTQQCILRLMIIFSLLHGLGKPQMICSSTEHVIPKKLYIVRSAGVSLFGCGHCLDFRFHVPSATQKSPTGSWSKLYGSRILRTGMHNVRNVFVAVILGGLSPFPRLICWKCLFFIIQLKFEPLCWQGRKDQKEMK